MQTKSCVLGWLSTHKNANFALEETKFFDKNYFYQASKEMRQVIDGQIKSAAFWLLLFVLSYGQPKPWADFQLYHIEIFECRENT